MCGIVGIISDQEVSERVLEGLKRLEYRGYDSAGIATIVNQKIESRRASGKLEALSQAMQKTPLMGKIGIGHTRWATHGAPTLENAHPHATHRMALVHNGIIENFYALREALIAKGVTFSSETDSEVVLHLIDQELQQGKSPLQAVATILPLLKGAFALVMLFSQQPDRLIIARKGSPLAIGVGKGEMFVGSDAFALSPFTQRIVYLEEGDYAEITREEMVIFDANQQRVSRLEKLSSLSGALVGKGEFRHFMLKEIYEQPTVFGNTLHVYHQGAENITAFTELPFQWKQLERLYIVGCGTSYYAAMVAKYWFEHFAKLPIEIDIASEYRYRQLPPSSHSAMLCISQSGETADTLAALQFAKPFIPVLSLVNVPESSMSLQAHYNLLTYAGPEIGVASTKAFTTQLAVLACLVIDAAIQRDHLSGEEAKKLRQTLAETSGRMAHILQQEETIKQLARDILEAKDVLYMGRGVSYPIALEGALKLKELSYIHAEGMAAGELKHGPIALVDETVPVIVIAPSSDPLFEKTVSNAQEVAARGGKVIAISDEEGIEALKNISWRTLTIPACHSFIAPMLYVVPIQLLAYHIAVFKGTDVDQPRNLAKSVTVE